MAYAIYRELDGKTDVVISGLTKVKINSFFNLLRRNFKKEFTIEDVRTGYFKIADLSAEYWIAKIEETAKEKYVGKWYSHNVCGSRIIVKITGIEKAGEQYSDDSYIGKKTMIFQDGNSMSEDWSCCCKAFESMLKDKEIKEFKF